MRDGRLAWKYALNFVALFLYSKDNQVLLFFFFRFNIDQVIKFVKNISQIEQIVPNFTGPVLEIYGSKSGNKKKVFT